ncbi:hypothetical protein HCU01_42260 [Halomonas cupida]|uniref:Uncharacterized protein n=1 Tax=Halomonas cupida TaxID=44933 RepID=A0ABQ0WL16_9GAMM|nr:hypothetical protein HCU01_42260 [Halomonas cupida]
MDEAYLQIQVLSETQAPVPAEPPAFRSVKVRLDLQVVSNHLPANQIDAVYRAISAEIAWLQ